jgi:V/A-type H+-transporting ATPase subunit A
MQTKSGQNSAVVTWISGPVLRARTEDPFQVNESVLVGDNNLLGEVIRIKGNEIILQVYEDTSGMRPGDKVTGDGMPLSIRLGPSILGNIFDGLLRPMSISSGDFVIPGMFKPVSTSFSFIPLLETGSMVNGSMTFGTINPEQGRQQHCLVPPGIRGEIVRIAGPGSYRDDETVCVIRDNSGNEHNVSMSHYWPVRQPRPVKKRIPAENPLLTGQRILDCLFPLSAGGRAAMPGGFGTGKTVLQETLAKWCDADIIIYVGCGERGNEMAGVLHEFPQLQDPRSGQPLMERTVIIANTSNMPVAAREASIYTAVTVAEYFRDQGLHVALMADSTSRWAEALREVSGRLGELPSEAGYPAYLSSRLADFYERAAQVETMNNETGSLSIIGAVSPPSADFSEPVTTHTKRFIRSFWALDSVRAHARFYPAIDPLVSYTESDIRLAEYWKKRGNPQWADGRRRFLTLLEQQQHLERMARIVGKDALPPRQQHILLCADLINEGFLRQSAFSENDRYCSPEKQANMMRLIMRFIELSENAVQAGVEIEQINNLKILRKLYRMGEDIQNDKPGEFDLIEEALEKEFTMITRKGTEHAG